VCGVATLPGLSVTTIDWPACGSHPALIDSLHLGALPASSGLSVSSTSAKATMQGNSAGVPQPEFGPTMFCPFLFFGFCRGENPESYSW
jgi:hypothetical protein